MNNEHLQPSENSGEEMTESFGIADGYVKLYRQIRKNPFYSNSVAFHIWVECLLRSSHAGRSFYLERDKIFLVEGQFVMGYREFSNIIGHSVSTLKYWLDQFVSERMIERKSNANGTIITILNWNKFQRDERLPERSANAQRTLSEPNKNDKNYNNDKNTSAVATVDDGLKKEKIEIDKEILELVDYQIRGIAYANPAFKKKFSSENSEKEESALRDLAEKWYPHFEKLIRLDKASHEEVRRVIAWLYSGKTRNAVFWKKNILSSQKFREQWQKLVAACIDDNQQNTSSLNLDNV